MSNKKSNLINVNVLVSWGGAIIILALCTKILHYAWAEKFIVVAFALEALLFVVMGWQKRGGAESNENPGATVNYPGSAIDEKVVESLVNALRKLEETNGVQSNLLNALIGEVGVKHLAESLKTANELSSLDLKSLQNEIGVSKTGFESLNGNLAALNEVYSRQIEAFKVR